MTKNKRCPVTRRGAHLLLSPRVLVDVGVDLPDVTVPNLSAGAHLSRVFRQLPRDQLPLEAVLVHQLPKMIAKCKGQARTASKNTDGSLYPNYEGEE